MNPFPSFLPFYPCVCCFFSLFPTWNPVCVTKLLLGMEPVLTCGRPIRDHTSEKNWILFSWQFSNTSSSSSCAGTSSPSFLQTGVDFTWLEFVQVS